MHNRTLGINATQGLGGLPNDAIVYLKVFPGIREEVFGGFDFGDSEQFDYTFSLSPAVAAISETMREQHNFLRCYPGHV
jgi:hypothetical protein